MLHPYEKNLSVDKLLMISWHHQITQTYQRHVVPTYHPLGDIKSFIEMFAPASTEEETC